MKFLLAETPQGPIEALAFTSDTESRRYARLSETETAQIIATASGFADTNLEYLDGIVEKLRQLS